MDREVDLVQVDIFRDDSGFDHRRDHNNGYISFTFSSYSKITPFWVYLSYLKDV
jgi:hypothetical protein